MKRSLLVLVGTVVCAFAGGFTTRALAESSAADALLQNAGPGGVPPAMTMVGNDSTVKLDDAFLQQFFAFWQTQPGMPFEVNQWAGYLVRHDFDRAAYFWSAVEPKFPDAFRVHADIAYLYVLWKLQLNQTFANELIAQLARGSFQKALLGPSLYQVIMPGFDHWVATNVLTLTPEQRHQIEALPQRPDPVAASLQAWVALREGVRAKPLLAMLPVTSELKIPLAETVALDLARQGKLADAALVLKSHLEPAIEAKHDPRLLSRHYLEIARLLYQAGSLDGAEQFYRKIPRGIDEYFPAQEELTWVWLRKGDITHLRGQVTSLGSSLFQDRFSPETFLVRSISDLKLCFYSEVVKDINNFQKRNVKWAKEITDASASEDPPAPPEKDYFTDIAEKQLALRSAEAERLQDIATKSITAALPAVGVQKHWEKQRDLLREASELARKQKVAEYRRQWKNRHQVLAEAIRKMKFVKVELLSQVHDLAESTPSVGSKAANIEQMSAISSSPDELSFPYDGTIWPDEVFQLQSKAQGRCLAGGAR